MAQEIGVGLIGYGGIGRVHALCLRMLPVCYPDLPLRARLVAVGTSNPASATRASEELGGVAATANLQELLNNPDVGLVDCCTPTDDHLRVARAALEAGKPLFCEKPLAASLPDAQALAALAAQQGLLGGVNYHFRFVPAVQEARRLIDEGALGELISFHMRYYRSSNLKRDRPISWRFDGPGSGVLVDLGSHLIDLVLHLVGPVERLSAHTRTLVPERPGPDGAPVLVQSDDMVSLRFELAGGAAGTAEASKVVPGAADDLRLELYGTKGTLIFDTADPNGLLVGDGAGIRRVSTLSRAALAGRYPTPELTTAPLMWHLASMAAFLSAIGSGTTPTPSLQDGVEVDRVIAAARASAASGGTTVAV